MAEYKDNKNGSVFPTRTGDAQGGAFERKKLDIVQGASGIRTRVTIHPDGSQTTLRTRNGMPEFVTTKVDDESKGVLPRGLVSYPFVGGDTDYSWSKPCVIEWDEDEFSWITTYYNPPQTAGKGDTALPKPPEFRNIEVRYWSSAKEATCLVCDDEVIFYGESIRKRAYVTWTYKKFSKMTGVLGLPHVPFINEGAKLLITHDEDSGAYLYSSSGTLKFPVTPRRHYDGGDHPYKVVLPTMITAPDKTTDDVMEVGFNFADATRWGNSYDELPTKAYYSQWLTWNREDAAWYSKDLFLASIPSIGIANVPHAGKADVDDDVTGVDTTMDGFFMVHNRDGAYVGVFACRPTDSDGFISDLYNPLYYIPKHQTFTLIPPPDEPTFPFKTHQWREDTFILPPNGSDILFGTVLTEVGEKQELRKVAVLPYSDLNMRIRAEGWHFRVNTAIPDATLWPDYGYNSYLGETHREVIERKVETNARDTIRISIPEFDAMPEIFLFKHSGTGQSTAHARDQQVISQIISNDLTWLEGVEGTLDKARWFSNSDIPACTPPLDNPYPGDPIGPDLQAKPTVSSVVGSDNPIYSEGWRDESEFSPYAGTAAFDASSCTILAYDPVLQFAAWLKLTVDSSCSFTSPGDSWLISRTSAQMNTPHSVSASIVVYYKGVQTEETLFVETFTKPGPWDHQEIEDWLSWPWLGSVPSSMYLVGPPRITPDASKFKNMDNVFNHQGVSPYLAGIRNPKEPEKDCLIFAARFTIAELKADWIFSDYAVSEIERGAENSESYFYCPELKVKVEDTKFNILFDHNGLRSWVEEAVKPVDELVVPESTVHESICYKV